jgi:hypothetical protein
MQELVRDVEAELTVLVDKVHKLKSQCEHGKCAALVCVCVCVCERERERESLCVCV